MGPLSTKEALDLFQLPNLIKDASHKRNRRFTVPTRAAYREQGKGCLRSPACGSNSPLQQLMRIATLKMVRVP